MLMESLQKNLASGPSTVNYLKPETSKPEASKPEASKPEAAKPEAAKPETMLALPAPPQAVAAETTQAVTAETKPAAAEPSFEPESSPMDYLFTPTETEEEQEGKEEEKDDDKTEPGEPQVLTKKNIKDFSEGVLTFWLATFFGGSKNICKPDISVYRNCYPYICTCIYHISMYIGLVWFTFCKFSQRSAQTKMTSLSSTNRGKCLTSWSTARTAESFTCDWKDFAKQKMQRWTFQTWSNCLRQRTLTSWPCSETFWKAGRTRQRWKHSWRSRRKFRMNRKEKNNFLQLRGCGRLVSVSPLVA